MKDRFDFATLVTGLIVALIGAAPFAEGLGWWELRLRDFRYTGPVLLLAIGVTVLIGPFARRHAEDRVSLPGRSAALTESILLRTSTSE